MNIYTLLDEIIRDLNNVPTTGEENLLRLATSILKLREIRKQIKIVDNPKQTEKAEKVATNGNQ